MEHHRNGRIDEARSLYEEVLQQQPNDPSALQLLGVICYQQKDYASAKVLIRKAIAVNPSYFEAHGNLGSVLSALDRPQEAIASFEAALRLNPNFADAHNNLGREFSMLGRKDEARECFERALAIEPNHVLAHGSLADILRVQGRLDDAMAHYRKAIALKPDFSGAHNNLGLSHAMLDQMDEAIACYLKALDSDLQNVDAFINLGNACWAQGNLKEALQCFSSAIALRPDSFGIYNNVGNVLRDIGEPQLALNAFNQALALNPDCADAHWNQSLTLLMMGRLKEGWEKYEWRWHTKEAMPRSSFTQAMWQGESLAGKTILVWSEQGVGDSLRLASCLPDIIAASGHCIVECDVRLVALFQRSFPTAEIIPAFEPPVDRAIAPDVAFQIPMGSLPRYFRPSIDSFPGRPGYLTPDPQRVAFWKSRLDGTGPGLRVGISWRSKHRTTERNIYYTELSQWGPIFAVPGVTFVNLQYGECRAELDEARARFGIEIHAWEDINLMDNLDDAAALTTALDLVISPHTSVSVMAGALGVPVWTMTLANEPMALGTGGSPWHPLMRLFFRTDGEPWESVVERIAVELRNTPQPSN